ncbi:tRNA (cytosine-5-)-methyltransferase [Lobulomyces angularis]|nr:tRNA (cytosine-5-)-methyltransferase [Lobulomyces angularis]
MELKCLEFFSGIGGMHYALQKSNLIGKVLESFDINPTANLTYEYNFNVKPNQISIEMLKVDYIEKLSANTWLLSPPCQPFTQGGLRKDSKDIRCTALFHLFEKLLPNLNNKPEYIFIENVANFAHSDAKSRILKVLRKNYQFFEFILSPLQFNIPNDRNRYYLLARKNSISVSQLQYKDSDIILDWHLKKNENDINTLSNYQLEENLDEFLVPSKMFKNRKTFSVGVIVKPSDTYSFCFTKAYGRHGVGSGSYLQTLNLNLDPIAYYKEFVFKEDETILLENNMLNQFNKKSSKKETDTEKLENFIKMFGIRYFSPLEVCYLNGFPIKSESFFQEKTLFKFNTSKTNKNQNWRMIGNSLNVTVVSELLKVLVVDDMFWERNKIS